MLKGYLSSIKGKGVKGKLLCQNGTQKGKGKTKQLGKIKNLQTLFLKYDLEAAWPSG